MTTTAHAEHKHPNYVAIWAVLLVALIVSLLLAYLEHAALAIGLIFAIAIVKAALVAGFYMHLKFETRYVIVAIAAGIVALGILFAGLFPDIVGVYGG
jgi:cytochrome c oxidase subunit 4